MSSDPEIPADLLQANFYALCCAVSVTAVFIYECLITFDREFHLVWKRKFTGATAFFLLNRYLILVPLILQLATAFPLKQQACVVLGWWLNVLEVLPPLVAAGFSSLRAYALSGGKWQIASLIAVLFLVSFGCQLNGVVYQIPIKAPPPINCVIDINISDEHHRLLIFLDIPLVIAADTLVLLVTIWQTYWTRRVSLQANVKASFTSLIWRDGTMYFLTLVSINVMNLIVWNGDGLLSNIRIFTDPITAILVCRFILNLRDIDSTDANGSHSRGNAASTRSTVLRFASFVEPLGASLDDAHEDAGSLGGHTEQFGIDHRENLECGNDVGERMDASPDRTTNNDIFAAEAGPSGV